jgi:ABC-type nitrate/sulfonate/bicarbonate transport system substrate-binding protein
MKHRFSRSRRNALNALGALTAGTLATSWLAALPRAAHGAAMQPVRLGYQYHLWGAPAVVALKKGFFAAEGLTVDDRKFASGVDTRNAMVGGAIDIGTVGITPFIVGASRGELVALATVCYAGKTALVMARSGSGVKTIADLRGKRIASQVGSTLDDVFKKRIGPEANLTEKDYQIINVKFSDQVSALAAGSVDAMLNLEPFCSIAEERKLAVPLTDYFKYDLIPNMLTVNRPFVEKHPETCVAFLRGWLRAVELFAKQPQEAAAIMLSVYKEGGYEISDALVRRVIDRLVVTPDFIPELPAYMNSQATALRDAKRIQTVPEPAAVLLKEPLANARAKR